MAHPEIPAGTVVVGVDGSEDADRAVAWGARQAHAERRPLTLLHATNPAPLVQTSAMGLMALDHGTVLEALREDGRAVLHAAVDLAVATTPDVVTWTALVEDDPRRALVSASREAHLVVGSRGRGPLRNTLLGSVSASVARHAAAPVVVCRPRRGASATGVVVGTDGGPGSAPALELAFRQASCWHVPLTVMPCFTEAGADVGPNAPEESPWPPGPGDLRRVLAEAVAGLREKFPDVDVTLDLDRGLVEECLAERTPAGTLLVVGRPEVPLRSRLLHASCALALLERAPGEVAVVPQVATEDQLR